MFSGGRLSKHLIVPQRIASPRNPRRDRGSLRTKLLGKMGTQNDASLDDSDEYIPLQRNSGAQNSGPIHHFDSNPNQRSSIILSIGEDPGEN